MTELGIVGAGAAAAAACYVVDGALPDASITVLEKSGGVCGRAATRRRGDVTYDYGANYLKDDDQRVVDLVHEFDDGLVDVQGDVHVFDRTGTVSEGRDARERKFTYRTGLTRLAKHLFGATDATVNRRTRVERVARTDDGRWTATDADGERWGPFDALLLNPPAPQTAALLETADWDAAARDDPPGRPMAHPRLYTHNDVAQDDETRPRRGATQAGGYPYSIQKYSCWVPYLSVSRLVTTT